MNRRLEQLVWKRAEGRCEYCRLPSDVSVYPFEVDHIIAKKHGGLTVSGNLALACYYCNTYKGPNIAGIDPLTQAVVPLFYPRRQVWTDHFRWDGAVLEGRTPCGRATVNVLRINHPDAVEVRRLLLALGVSL